MCDILVAPLNEVVDGCRDRLFIYIHVRDVRLLQRATDRNNLSFEPRVR